MIFDLILNANVEFELKVDTDSESVCILKRPLCVQCGKEFRVGRVYEEEDRGLCQYSDAANYIQGKCGWS